MSEPVNEELRDSMELRLALRRLESAEKAVGEARRALDAVLTRRNAESTVDRPAPAPTPTAPAPATPVAQTQEPYAPYAPYTQGPPASPVSAAPPTPVAPSPQKPPAPPKPPVPTETKVIRAIAVVGSLITVAGVGLAVALAIQNGLLGPLGRVLLSVLLAVTLLGAGLWLDRRRTAAQTDDAPPGVTALVVTSFLVLALVLHALTDWLGWWEEWQAVAALLVVWLAYLGLTRKRWLRAVAICLAVIAPFLIGRFYTSWDAATWPIVLLPLTLLALSWRWRLPEIRTAAAVVAVIVQVGVTLASDASAVTPMALFGIVSAVAFAVVTLMDRHDDQADVTNAVISPLLILAAAMLPTGQLWVVWLFIPATAALAALGYTHDSPVGRVLGPAGLCATAVAFVGVWALSPRLGIDWRIDATVVVAAFFLAAVAVIIWLHRTGEARVWPWAFWLVAALILTGHLSRNVLAKTPLWLTDHSAAIQAVLIAVFLAVAVRHRQAMAGFPVWAQVTFAVAALHLSMVAIVTFVTWAGQLLGGGAGMWLGYLIGHALVSILWMVLAAWILLAAKGISPRASLGAGMVLAIAGVVKLVFFDLGTLEGLPRALAFLISGVALLAMAALRARRGSEDPV